MQYRGVASVDRARDDQARDATPSSRPMAQSLPSQMPAEVTQRWRVLAEQRYAHFLELHQTGRWKHYYTEHDFLIRMRETMRLLDMWKSLSGPETTVAEESNGTA
jgi:hypothetical protein